MSGELRTFDPEKVTVTWSPPTGAIDMTEGLIDGDGAITEAKDAPEWTRRGDRNGNMLRIKSCKKGGTLSLTYVAEAPIQNELSALINTDQQTGTVIGVLKVKDLNGSTVAVYTGAFIESGPPLSFGTSAADRLFVMGYAERVVVYGGNEAG